MFAHIMNASMFKILAHNITNQTIELFKRCRFDTMIDYEQANCYQLISDAKFFISNSWMNHRDQHSWKDKFMKSMTAAAAAYAIFIKKTSIFVIKIIINIMISILNQIVNKTSIFIILTESISTSIDFSFEHVLLNDITMYDIKTIISQLIIAMYAYSDIWKNRKITIDIFEAE